MSLISPVTWHKSNHSAVKTGGSDVIILEESLRQLSPQPFSMDDGDFNLISSYIKSKIGLNLGSEKRSLIYSRLRGILLEKRFSSLAEYYDYLTGDATGAALNEFISRVTTNHTFFMREPDHFDYFSRTALPQIERLERGKDIRLWCSGCSTGQEAYTLQILLMEYFRDKPGWDTRILATDISSEALGKAVRGVYSANAVEPLPEAWIRNYFVRSGGVGPNGAEYTASGELKRGVIFRKFNLMDAAFPFKKPFQVIFCRNVMIYFDTATRDELVSKFSKILLPGGYLFIGHSETIRGAPDLKYIAPALYQKI